MIKSKVYIQDVSYSAHLHRRTLIGALCIILLLTLWFLVHIWLHKFFVTIRANESILSGDTTDSSILPLVSSPVSTVAPISVDTEQRFITVFAKSSS